MNPGIPPAVIDARAITDALARMATALEAIPAELAGLRQGLAHIAAVVDTHTDQLERIEAAATEESGSDLVDALRALVEAIHDQGARIEGVADVLGALVREPAE